MGILRDKPSVWKAIWDVFLFNSSILQWSGCLWLSGSITLANIVAYRCLSSKLYIYGYKPPPLAAVPLQDCAVEVVMDFLRSRQHLSHIIRENLLPAQNRMKQHADKRRSERQFKVGNWVYLRLKPYRQSSLSIIKNFKLCARFCGSYQVLARVGAVAYKLQLPPEITIHHVFHVSFLKKKVGDQAVIIQNHPSF